MLHLEGLRKKFGALVVTDDLTFDVRPNELHAVIGPNGAGKTTLINQISGLVAPDAGSIAFAGRDITTLPAHARAGLGLARTFQVSSILPGFSALENVALAVQARSGSSLPLPGGAAAEPALNGPAMAARAGVGLAVRAPTPARQLSHGGKRAFATAIPPAREPKLLPPDRRPAGGELSQGEKRALDLAIGRGLGPKRLLLEEPMAGGGRDETTRLVGVLGQLKGRFSVVLVGHDMTAVFALADRISVLIYGHIIATGTPAEVRADPRVVAAYLGDDME